MRLTEQIDIKAVTVVAFGCAPRKGSPAKVAKRRSRKPKIATPKTGKVAVRLQAPLTRTMAELLGVEALLFEGDREVPRDGYKRISLDVDYFSNVRLQVRSQEPDAVLDVIADRLERWVVLDVKGSGPMLQWDARTTGYVSQLADFVSLIDNVAFVVSVSPAQGNLGFEQPAAAKAAGQALPELYRVT